MVGNRGVDKDHSFCRQFMWLVTEGRQSPFFLPSVHVVGNREGDKDHSLRCQFWVCLLLQAKGLVRSNLFFIEWDYVFSFQFYRNEYLKCLRSLFTIYIDRNNFEICGVSISYREFVVYIL